MPSLKTRTLTILAAALALAATGTALAQPTPSYTPIGVAGLEVTEGSITPAGVKSTLETQDPAMRAVAVDGGRHASSARLWFRYLGESTTTVPLGSGLIRRQIGVKLLAGDPCNLLYVMWHAYPDDAIEVQLKSNPGQTTSAECGNAGYSELTTIPLGPGDGTADHAAHRLEVQTRRRGSGAVALTVIADGAAPRKVIVPETQAGGLDGPIGVRSDNGHYLFRLAGSH